MHDALPIYTIIHRLLLLEGGGEGGGSALPCNYWGGGAKARNSNSKLSLFDFTNLTAT